MTSLATQAKKLGYTLRRGAYQGTCDDSLDRWYVDHVDNTITDRRGPGYATRREALETLAERLGGT